jgi:hypothetical protein
MEHQWAPLPLRIYIMPNDHFEQREQMNGLTLPKVGDEAAGEEDGDVGSVGTVVLPPYAGRAAMALPWPPLDLHRLKADLAVGGGDLGKGLGFKKIGRRCREMREAGRFGDGPYAFSPSVSDRGVIISPSTLFSVHQQMERNDI